MTTKHLAERKIGVSMTKVRQQLRQRNWVAKNNFNRPVRHRDPTQYQRQPKHKQKEIEHAH
jgi:hypothetical protein